MIIIKGKSKCKFNFYIKDGVSEEDLLYIIKDKDAGVKIDKIVSNISIKEWEKKEKKIKKYINER